MGAYEIPDGLAEIEDQRDLVIDLIAKTARWVHPEIFHVLPVWRPEMARGQQLYNAAWTRIATNKDAPKKEGNVSASKALKEALGMKTSYKPQNWTTCHIWGYDDPRFAKSGGVVRDPRFFSCVGNMVLLPTPLKGFTDAVPEVKHILRHCAYRLYGWACEHEDVAEEAEQVRTQPLPDYYPACWPGSDRDVLPPGTAPASPHAQDSAEKAKARIRDALANDALLHYPRDQVRDVLAFWNIEL